jgi:hypothetical protein
VAESSQEQLDRMLAVAALLRRVLGGAPVVVGGVAEMYWTRLPYHPTDGRTCAAASPPSRRTCAR